MAEELANQIAETAKLPKSYENDGEKVTQHSLQDLIAADKHISKKRAGRNPWGAIRVVRISTQGPEK